MKILLKIMRKRLTRAMTTMGNAWSRTKIVLSVCPVSMSLVIVEIELSYESKICLFDSIQ